MNIRDYFYTAKESAKLLDINRITIWRWVKEGKFDTQYIGREVLIPKWQIDLIKEKKRKEKKRKEKKRTTFSE
jgi:excisionase family DNA binding protein